MSRFDAFRFSVGVSLIVWIAACDGQVLSQAESIEKLRAVPATSLFYEDQKLVAINGHVSFDDEALSFLASFDTIREVSLLDSSVTAKGLKAMGNQSSLQSFAPGSKLFRDDGIEVLVGYKKLRNLYLDGTGVTDVCLDFIISMQSLEDVGILSTEISKEGIERLRAERPELRIY